MLTVQRTDHERATQSVISSKQGNNKENKRDYDSE